MANARALGLLDMLASHADHRPRNWGTPRMSEAQGIDISEGRHPVIEQQLPLGETYVVQRRSLDPERRQMLMVTGPNMSGKSASCDKPPSFHLMAQAGSFVPAKAADSRHPGPHLHTCRRLRQHQQRRVDLHG